MIWLRMHIRAAHMKVTSLALDGPHEILTRRQEFRGAIHEWLDLGQSASRRTHRPIVTQVSLECEDLAWIRDFRGNRG
jgi:hypothetical protein